MDTRTVAPTLRMPTGPLLDRNDGTNSAALSTTSPSLMHDCLRRKERKKEMVYLTKEGRKEMFYLTTHSTHFIYGYMASDIR